MLTQDQLNTAKQLAENHLNCCDVARVVIEGYDLNFYLRAAKDHKNSIDSTSLTLLLEALQIAGIVAGTTKVMWVGCWGGQPLIWCQICCRN